MSDFILVLYMPRSRICACGCLQEVSSATEARHLRGRGSQALAATILLQNKWLLRQRCGERQTGSEANHTQFAMAAESDSDMDTNAGTGNDVHSIGEGLHMDILSPSPAAEFAEPLPDLPTPALNPSGDINILSATRRSSRLIARELSRRRWGEEDTEEEPDDNTEGLNAFMEGPEEDPYILDEDEEALGDVLPSAAPGDEGLSMWDLLGEGFEREAAAIGKYPLFKRMAHT
jgi:hypothetical protein